MILSIKSTPMENSNQLRQDQIQFTCEICEKDFKNRNGLKHHLNMAHNVAKGYQCNLCEKVFNIQSQITNYTCENCSWK